MLATSSSLNALSFQFLMVRLKATRRGRCRSPSPISIPYGSIKRSQRGGGQREAVISIPYGSIKSQRRPDQFTDFNYFNSLWFD